MRSSASTVTRSAGPDRWHFEQWVMLQVIYLNHALRKGWKLSSYRTEAGAEVDLVVERARDVVRSRSRREAGDRGRYPGAPVAGRSDGATTSACDVARLPRERALRFGSGVEALPVLEALRRLVAD